MNAAHDHSPSRRHDHDHAGHDHGHSHSHHGHSHSHGGHSHGPVDTGDWRYAVGLVVNLLFVACAFGAGLIAEPERQICADDRGFVRVVEGAHVVGGYRDLVVGLVVVRFGAGGHLEYVVVLRCAEPA